MTEKFCKAKQHWLPLSAFEKRSDRDGYRATCRECRNASYRERYARTRPEYVEPEPLNLSGFLPWPGPVEAVALVARIGRAA